MFVERVLETTVWARENARKLIIGVTLLVVLGAGFLWYRNNQVRLRDRAETELTAIRPTALSGNAALAIRDLEAYLSRFGETPAASEARLLLAKAYLENKEPQKAITALAPLTADLSRPLAVAAALLQAAAQESAIQTEAAIATYLRIADGAPFDFQKWQALENAARLRFEKGDPAGAAQLYERILTLLPPDDPNRSLFEMRQAEAAARAQSG